MADRHVYFEGRTALVTGASAGIGRRVAETLAEHGMNVVLAARSVDKLDSLASELEAFGIRALAVPTDVSIPADLERLVRVALQEFGAIDVLINNAGIDAFHDFHTLPVARIRRTIDVNLISAITLTRLVIPQMLDRRCGRIINMASTAGRHGPAHGGVYGATKAGLIAFTQSLRAEYHRSGVGITAICPGFTDDGGIYERMKRQTGRTTSPLMGSTSADAVAKAVWRALHTSPPEVIVNRLPVRPIMLLRELFPSLGEWLIRKASARFLRVVSRDDDQPHAADHRNAA